jgi:hypothetical protein
MVRMGDRRPLGKPPEVSEYLGVPETTLAQWRWLGTGPRWSTVGRHVRYRWEDVERYIDAKQGSRAA